MFAGIDLDSIKRSFDENGFARIPGFLDSTEAREAGDRLDRFIAELVPDLAPEEIFYEIEGQPDMIKSLTTLSTRDSYFHDLFNSERFGAVAEGMLGAPASPPMVHLLNKVPRIGKETLPHQDAAYLTIAPGQSVTFWLALDEADENNGAMLYLRGSHRAGLRHHEDTGSNYFAKAIFDYQERGSDEEVMAPAQPGDLLVHHSLTIHRTGLNHSERSRRALIADFILDSAGSG